ncbi:copper resistance CopC/CopD family protein [Kribbella catacumbae]|uniref:copper resistance CopC/CopD family protein n=1 Tax=Kribbella catacumbae TaxID=460086 RepID=UPI0003A1397B|nr:copper resistance protein CopC [Kribbella catacumbae]
MRVAVRVAVVACVVPLVLFGTALPARAHPTLLSTTPEAGYSVSSAPDQVTMVFDEAVSVEARGVRIENDHGEQVSTDEVVSEQGGRRLVVRVLDDLQAGRYVVRWRVTAQDGDVVDADFDFAVATDPSSLRGRETASTAAFPVVSILRWLFFLGLVGLLGGLVGERIARRTAPEAVAPRSLVRPAALLGMLATSGLLVQLVVSSGGMNRAGYLLGLETLGLAVVAALGGRTRWWLAAPPILLVVAAESLRNHLGTQRGAVGVVLIAVHLVAIAVWVGSLVHLVRVALANRGGTGVGRAFAAYSRLALGLFVLVATTGTVSALLLVPSLSALTGTTYGLTLLAKLGLVIGVAVLAWFGRRRLSGSPASLTRAARREAAALVIVLAASAILVSLPTPAPATADIGYPPPVNGPVIRLGTLAGQIAVGIAASENQLEVRLRVPDDQNQLGETRPPDYRVAARANAPGHAAEAVSLRPCGPGCFVGPVPWRPGTGYADLRVDAPGWTGGAAVFPIHWAPVVSGDALPRVRAAMLAQPLIRVVETVTSDTSRPAPKPQTVTLTGRQFLDSDPYGSPPDPDVVLRPRPAGGGVLTFGLPAEGVHVELEVDASYRIIRETLAAPKHLTQRTFSYPG